MTKKESNVMQFRGIQYKRILVEDKSQHRCNSCDLQKFLDADDYPSECTCLDMNKGEVINSYYWKVIDEHEHEPDPITVCPHCGELHRTMENEPQILGEINIYKCIKEEGGGCDKDFYGSAMIITRKTPEALVEVIERETDLIIFGVS